MSTTTAKEFLTKQELADRYGVSTRRIQQLIEAGVIPVYRLGDRIARFDPTECDKALRR